MTKTQQWRALWNKARAAGHQAVQATQVRPMIVGSPTTLLGNDIDYSQPTYVVEGGVCGFAWVNFKGNTSFGRWAKKEGLARKNSYSGGLDYWISDYGQSMQRKEAYARAFAAVLREGGVTDAYAGSRMD